ncbi:MAG: methyltransferase [Thermoplasmatota archaeon]
MKRFTFNDLEYEEDHLVYPVEEDTLLLLRSIEHELCKNKGRFLEMGCGTGLISLRAASMGWDTFSVDIEPRALGLVRRNLRLNGLNGRQYLSDLYQGIPRSCKDSFDLICFNPPYVGSGKASLSRRDGMALEGGPGGWEKAYLFLIGSTRFLNEAGRVQILMKPQWDNEMSAIGQHYGSLEKGEINEISGERFSVWTLTQKQQLYPSSKNRKTD